jgi:hypothetical protein
MLGKNGMDDDLDDWDEDVVQVDVVVIVPAADTGEKAAAPRPTHRA